MLALAAFQRKPSRRGLLNRHDELLLKCEANAPREARVKNALSFHVKLHSAYCIHGLTVTHQVSPARDERRPSSLTCAAQGFKNHSVSRNGVVAIDGQERNAMHETTLRHGFKLPRITRRLVDHEQQRKLVPARKGQDFFPGCGRRIASIAESRNYVAGPLCLPRKGYAACHLQLGRCALDWWQDVVTAQTCISRGAGLIAAWSLRAVQDFRKREALEKSGCFVFSSNTQRIMLVQVRSKRGQHRFQTAMQSGPCRAILARYCAQMLGKQAALLHRRINGQQLFIGDQRKLLLRCPHRALSHFASGRHRRHDLTVDLL